MKPFQSIFFEIHTEIPREGPGDDDSTRRALCLMRGLPDSPMILDCGCGPGQQTFALAEATNGHIVALDLHTPFLNRLRARAVKQLVLNRVHVVRASMGVPPFAPSTFDAIWAEGSVYVIGFESGLRMWRRYLKRGGMAAVTELSWLKDDPPVEIARYWEHHYPEMRTVERNADSVATAGYSLIDHFALPESAWLANYYGPIKERHELLRVKYARNPAALAQIAESESEIDMHVSYSEWYGYVFYIMRNATEPDPVPE